MIYFLAYLTGMVLVLMFFNGAGRLNEQYDTAFDQYYKDLENEKTL